MRFLVALIMIQIAFASDLTIGPQVSSRDLAFARYVTSLQRRNPLTESGPVGVLIEASVPRLYKMAALLAIRERGESERCEYRVLGIEGDGTVAEEVMTRYFAVSEQMENLPLSSVLITPANYKFRFRGEVNTGGHQAYIYDITPKKSGPGLIKGQLWMDADTGAELLVTGRLTNGGIDMVRETKLLDGPGYGRVTHVSCVLPLLGRTELVITECPLPVDQLRQKKSRSE